MALTIYQTIYQYPGVLKGTKEKIDSIFAARNQDKKGILRANG